MNFVYILYSRQLDRYYIGYCSMSVEDRLSKHLSNHKGYTGRAKDWEICYTESYSTRQAAYRRERALKRWKSRKRIEDLISQYQENSSVGSEHPD
ncbi:MAG: GIY-YIG nuclease family protein [Saprospiraceae bacterium]|nr:GIY-YIG nuclease family protein [Saprospiraceae bacterium]